MNIAYDSAGQPYWAYRTRLETAIDDLCIELRTGGSDWALEPMPTKGGQEFIQWLERRVEAHARSRVR